MIINGVDTIRPLVGNLPTELTIPRELVKAAELVRQGWNLKYVAVVPYCFKCKCPLNWHIHEEIPASDNIIFDCPQCHTVWRCIDELHQAQYIQPARH